MDAALLHMPPLTTEGYRAVIFLLLPLVIQGCCPFFPLAGVELPPVVLRLSWMHYHLSPALPHGDSIIICLPVPFLHAASPPIASLPSCTPRHCLSSLMLAASLRLPVPFMHAASLPHPLSFPSPSWTPRYLQLLSPPDLYAARLFPLPPKHHRSSVAIVTLYRFSLGIASRQCELKRGGITFP